MMEGGSLPIHSHRTHHAHLALFQQLLAVVCRAEFRHRHQTTEALRSGWRDYVGVKGATAGKPAPAPTASAWLAICPQGPWTPWRFTFIGPVSYLVPNANIA